MWNLIKTIPLVVKLIDQLVNLFKGISARYSAWKKRRRIKKIHRAIKKAKTEKNTEDLQKELSKLL